MKFQPGQSGNPAGRPLGARNKKTIAIEEEVAKNAEEAVAMVIRRAKGGDPTCLRLLMERVMPTGTDRPLPLELPKVECADDAQKALDMVIEAFGRGAITVREFSPMLGCVDRMARVAERIQQNRERERERYGARRVHGIHPDMIPKAPPGWTDPDEAIKAANERGENPWPDDPSKLAYVLEGEELFPSVNSGSKALVSSADDTAAAVEPSVPAADGLYFSVNSAESAREEETPRETLAPSLPRERSERGEGGSPDSREKREEGEPGGGSFLLDSSCAERSDQTPPTPDPSPPLYERGEGNPAAAANTPEDESLYSPVNFAASSEHSVAGENLRTLPDGSRLVAALTTAEGGREPLYLNPQPGPDPLAEVRRIVESMASDADPPPLNPG